jgi:putative transposase
MQKTHAFRFNFNTPFLGPVAAINLVGDVSRTPELHQVCATRHGISQNTFYRWKSKYGGLEVSDARRLKSLEDENARLKKLLADAELDKSMLKDALSKKW